MQIRQTKIFSDLLVTLTTQRSLRLVQHTWVGTFMRRMTGQTSGLCSGLMVHQVALGLVSVAIETELIAGFAQQRRLPFGRQVWPMAGQALPLADRAMDIAAQADIFAVGEILETMALKTEILRIGFRHTDKITGMWAVARKTVTISHRCMGLALLKKLLLLIMTGKTEIRRFIVHRKRLCCRGTRMAIVTASIDDRLMSMHFKQLLVVRRMDTVAIGASPIDRVAAVSLDKILLADIVAILTERALLFDQQHSDLGTMRLVTGPTALLHRLMNKLATELILTMTFETELFFTLPEQTLLRGIVMLMARRTLAVSDRVMVVAVVDQKTGKILMTGEAELRLFDLQVGSPDQPVLAVATSTIAAFYRLMHDPLGVKLPVLGMAIETGLAPLGGPRTGSTGLPQPDQNDRNK